MPQCLQCRCDIHHGEFCSTFCEKKEKTERLEKDFAALRIKAERLDNLLEKAHDNIDALEENVASLKAAQPAEAREPPIVYIVPAYSGIFRLRD